MVDKTARFVSRLTKKTMALVLAGGRGSRLYDLTQWRAKPAVPSLNLLPCATQLPWPSRRTGPWKGS